MSKFRDLLMGLGSSPTPPTPIYTELAWLQGNSYQPFQNYFDTGYVPNDDTKIEVKYQFSSSVQHNYDRLFGAGDFTCITWNGNQIYVKIDSRRGDWDYNGFSANIPKDIDHIVQVTTSEIKLDNTILFSGSRNVVGTKTLLLFKNNYEDDDRDSCARIYYCKVWENDTLVRDIIPVLDENNVPCMYDKITNTFYYNQSSGSFSYGTLN